MKLRSWLSATCSSHASTVSVPQPQPTYRKRHVVSDSGSSSDNPISSSSSDTCSTSLHSNLSLQTLPSVPSLQKLISEFNAANISVSHVCITSLISPRQITCLAVHHNLLYAAAGHEINVYDGADFSLLDSFNAHDPSSGSVKSVSFSDGKVFTAHQDCKIKVWEIIPGNNKRHKLVTTLPTVNDRLLRFALPKNYVTVRRHVKRLWIQHADAVTSIAVNNGLVYSVSWDKSLKIWRDSNLRCVESVKAHEDAVSSVAVAKDGTVYTGSADRRIRVWARPQDGKRHVLVTTLEKHKSAVNALALNEDGTVLFSGACDRSILVWEREDSANHMAVTGALRGHGKAILCLFNVGVFLLSGSADRTVRMWQRGEDGSYCCLGVLEGHVKPVKAVVAVMGEGGGDGDGVVSVVSGSLDGVVKVWRVSMV
ncbi:protein JINGUBANG [Argentina anserina]|uniref:protein JINGUBANG n=1 Tax=Argentina anserina TaxID=57926 RepID=UPI0021762F63|nr:protein JINGUBANG [Potentilla anserina]